jgi:hypothetical protein
MCQRLRQETPLYAADLIGRRERRENFPPIRCRREWQPRV